MHARPNPQPDFAKAIEARMASLTPTHKRIATYLLANATDLPFETADEIAQKTGTSGISVGRCLRSLGYRNLDHLKQELRGRQSRPWLITDRLDAFRAQAADAGSDRLARSLELELDAIGHVYRLARTPMFARVAERLARADAVYVVGIQSTRGVANALYSYLEYIRPRVFYSDGMSGSYVDSLNSEFAAPYLVVTDTRAYSKIARRVCEAACRRKLPVALVTDIYCPWAHDFETDLLQVHTDVGQFRDSLAPFSSLFNLLITAVVERLGDSLDGRLQRNRALQRELAQFDL